MLKSRRHPSVKSLIFGAKNHVEIFDLEKTKEYLDKAKEFVKSLAKNNGMIVFVGGKNEAQDAVRKTAESVNFLMLPADGLVAHSPTSPNIRKRVERLEMLMDQREKGELSKYTKKGTTFDRSRN
jgi:small subunit ribosomal protein S2